MRKTILATVLLLVVSCIFSSSAFAASTTIVKKRIVSQALELGIDPALALSIAKKESGFCHERKSRRGAVGVFQLMPSTAKKLGYNPYKLNENIKGGLSYYKMLYNKFGSTELALAAYNAGPGNVKRYKGIPPFKETKRFVNIIMNDYYKTLKYDPIILQVKEQKGSTKNNSIHKGAGIIGISTRVKPSATVLPANSFTKTESIMPEKVLSLYIKQKNTITE